MLTLSVGSTVGAGVVITQNQVEHAPAASIAQPAALMQPATGAVDPDRRQAMSLALAGFSTDARLSQFSAMVTDAMTGDVVFEHQGDLPLRPASVTKVLTVAAALASMDPGQRIVTPVYLRDETAIVVAQGDIWFDGPRLDQLAQDIQAAAPGARRLVIDTSLWSHTWHEAWDPADIDAGFIAPIEPIMVTAARVGEDANYMEEHPRSHTPAQDFGQALGARLGMTDISVSSASVDGLTPIASSSSPTLSERVRWTMQASDNVMAEAIAREVDPANPVGGSLNVLQAAGIDIAGVSLGDNCGLDAANKISARNLISVLEHAAQAERHAGLAALGQSLATAGATGTLSTRFVDLAGRGLVHAKTGTLTETSSLAGFAPGKDGGLYSFAVISNDSEVLAARQALDEFASTLIGN